MHLLCKESAFAPLRRLMTKLDLTTMDASKDDENVIKTLLIAQTREYVA